MLNTNSDGYITHVTASDCAAEAATADKTYHTTVKTDGYEKFGQIRNRYSLQRSLDAGKYVTFNR